MISACFYLRKFTLNYIIGFLIQNYQLHIFLCIDRERELCHAFECRFFFLFTTAREKSYFSTYCKSYHQYFYNKNTVNVFNTHIKVQAWPHAPVAPEMWEGERQDDCWGFLVSSRFSKRRYFKGVRWTEIEKGIQCPLFSSAHSCKYTNLHANFL